jgi:hypothetical protein
MAAEPADNTPAAFDGELTQLFVGHRAQHLELGWVRDEDLWFVRERPRDLRLDRGQSVIAHLAREDYAGTGALCRAILPAIAAPA